MAKKPPPGCSPCKFIQWIVCLLLFIGAVASIVGVYKAHVVDGVTTFGTTPGSMALIAFAITITVWLKMMKECCPCDMK